MKQWIATALLTACAAAHAQTPGDFAACPSFFDRGAPRQITRTETKALCFDAFAVLYNRQTKTPVYVSEVLSRASIEDARDEIRTNRFYEEARLPSSWRATLEDYKGSGYDRGHQAPAADMPNATAMAQSFSLANMVPQDPDNNRGIWAKIEADVRHYVRRTGHTVHVTTGPAYLSGHGRTIGHGVAVPSHLFKIVRDSVTQKAWAYWVANSADARPEITTPEVVAERAGLIL